MNDNAVNPGWDDYRKKCVSVMDNIDNKLVDGLISILIDAYNKDKQIFIIGNGGSAANASHLANDLSMGTLWSKKKDQKRFRALSLTDCIPVITAWANDTSYEEIYEQQLKNLANPGDVLIAISGSGASPNILRAVKYANDNGLFTIGFTGFDGGKLKKIVKYPFHVELDDMGMTEGLHGLIFHFIAERLRTELKPEKE